MAISLALTSPEAIAVAIVSATLRNSLARETDSME